jgi:hypothetical protein
VSGPGAGEGKLSVGPVWELAPRERGRSAHRDPGSNRAASPPLAPPTHPPAS